MGYALVKAKEIIPSFIRNKIDKEADIYDIVNKILEEAYRDVEFEEEYTKKDFYDFYDSKEPAKTIYYCQEILKVSTSSDKKLVYTTEKFKSEYTKRITLKLSRELEEGESLSITYLKDFASSDNYEAIYPSLTHSIDKPVLQYVQGFFIGLSETCGDNINTKIILEKITQLHDSITKVRKI